MRDAESTLDQLISFCGTEIKETDVLAMFGLAARSQILSLAGAVLFDPEHQARAADIAAGFAVLLLPYSFVGPFAGVLLDRWWRQR